MVKLAMSTYELRIVREILEHEVDTGDTEDRPGAKLRALEKIDTALNAAA